MTFDSLGLSKNILKAVNSAGYDAPSPIQAQAIPEILNGRDIFGCAQTGTGKTAAFALPIMQMLDERGNFPRAKQFRALILTPTRELAEQISDNIAIYGKFLQISHCKVYGGVSQNPQIKMLLHGIDILVATPGRLLDLFKQKHLEFDGVEYLVLDEADRMLDMGFLPDIKKIISKLPQNRQSLLFSATLSDEIKTLASDIVKDPINISVSPESPTVDKIRQSVAQLSADDKLMFLEYILKERIADDENARALIFCRTKHGANKLAKKLNARKIGAAPIHGNKSQSARKTALTNFKEYKIRALVATDIAARGIDIKDMPLVINYDLPEEPETYVHRIGRTARAEASGEAISLITHEDTRLLRQIERFTKKLIPEYENNPYRVEISRGRFESVSKKQNTPQRKGGMQKNRFANFRQNKFQSFKNAKRGGFQNRNKRPLKNK